MPCPSVIAHQIRPEGFEKKWCPVEATHARQSYTSPEQACRAVNGASGYLDRYLEAVRRMTVGGVSVGSPRHICRSHSCSLLKGSNGSGVAAQQHSMMLPTAGLVGPHLFVLP